ncbi:MAG TPA: hypothetical protein VGS02_01265 [Acidobacteriaceae bacterium]|nr:hypothetical protein [Acidobacteriaceae bacterium]
MGQLSAGVEDDNVMCDYSLMAINNRLAVCGEELVVHRFEIRSMGLVAAADAEAAKLRELPPPRTFGEKLRRMLFPAEPELCPVVCIPPGARLLLCDVPEKLQRELKLSSPEQEVVFTELETTGYRDAVRFENGTVVLLQRLTEGMRVRVLALSSDEDEETAIQAATPAKAAGTARL